MKCIYILQLYIYTYIHRSKFLCDILRLKSWCSPVNLAGNPLWLVCSLWRGQQCQGSQAWESERIVGFSRFLSCVSKAVHQVCVWWSSFDYVSCLIDIHRAILSAQLSKVLFWSLVFQERWFFFGCCRVLRSFCCRVFSHFLQCWTCRSRSTTAGSGARNRPKGAGGRFRSHGSHGAHMIWPTEVIYV